MLVKVISCDLHNSRRNQNGSGLGLYYTKREEMYSRGDLNTRVISSVKNDGETHGRDPIANAS